jgi:hypothetical protein
MVASHSCSGQGLGGEKEIIIGAETLSIGIMVVDVRYMALDPALDNARYITPLSDLTKPGEDDMECRGE